MGLHDYILKVDAVVASEVSVISLMFF